MHYPPREFRYINFEGLTNIQLWRLDRKIWEHIAKRCGSTMAWDWPTLWMVYPGFANAIRQIRTEFSRR